MDTLKNKDDYRLARFNELCKPDSDRARTARVHAQCDVSKWFWPKTSPFSLGRCGPLDPIALSSIYNPGIAAVITDLDFYGASIKDVKTLYYVAVDTVINAASLDKVLWHGKVRITIYSSKYRRG